MIRVLLIALVALFLACPARADDQVSQGKYIATLGDCTSCHTAKDDHGYMAGGLPMNAPFGTIFSSNITPDPNFGIGKYTREQFIRVMREGVAADGHHLYPAMPYASFATMSDDDLNALYNYLMQGVKPVPYQVPKTKLIFPFNQRWGMALWDLVFARHDQFKPDPSRDEKWNRGAYLVQGAGHCGACHTPRGLAYEERGYDQSSPSYLRGALADDWASANLDGDLASGLGRWSESDIASFLKTGHGGGTAAFGNMKEVVEKSTQHMSDDDLAAIAHYLKSMPAPGENSRYAPTASSAANRQAAETAGEHELPGAGLFASSCGGCHGQDGSGHVPRYPALAGNPIVMNEDPTSLIRIVLEGSKSPQTDTGPKPAKMPSFANLTDREIAELVTFLRQDWGNSATSVDERQVATLRRKLVKIAETTKQDQHKADEQP